MGYKFSIVIVLSLLGSTLTGCSNTKVERPEDPLDKKRQRLAGLGKLMGDEAFTFGGESKSGDASGSTGIGVNYYLWRASLDVLSFLPTRSADPFGGVILTEWYTPPEMPQERVKVDVRILDRQLRADGLKVSIFKQTRDSHGLWRDVAVDAESCRALEEAILTRARELKINAR